MLKKIAVCTALAIFLMTPAARAEKTGHDAGKSADHGHASMADHGKEEPGKKDHGHAGHGEKHDMNHEDMIPLGEMTVEGVRATAHLKDVREEMAKAGMTATHHLQILFTDVSDGKTIEEGIVAVKIKSPSGEEGQAMPLTGMEGHFGADLTLDKQGEYSFVVGTKLPDSQKRHYHFEHTIIK